MTTIDVGRLLGAVTRETSTRELDGKPAVAVIATRSYDTSVADLWDAVTNPERISRWLAPIAGELKLGGRYEIEGNASGTITRCKPPEELALTWEHAGTTSWVEVRLEPAPRGAGTILRLEHLYHPWEEFEKTYGPGAGGVGWELSLAGLDLHLSSPSDAPTHAEWEGWLGTERGSAFIRGASEGWGAAAIAAGTPELAAREAARRTAEFYSQRAGGV
jgi:uncharacterized protein YndB with AHSA1/START domain